MAATAEQLLAQLVDQVKSLNRNFELDRKMERQTGGKRTSLGVDRDYDESMVKRMQREMRFNDISMKIYNERERELKNERSHSKRLIEQARKTGQYNNDMFRALESFGDMFTSARQSINKKVSDALKNEGTIGSENVRNFKQLRTQIDDILKIVADSQTPTKKKDKALKSFDKDILSQLDQGFAAAIRQELQQLKQPQATLTKVLSTLDGDIEKLSAQYNVNDSLRRNLATFGVQFDGLADRMETTLAYAHKVGDVYGKEFLKGKDQLKYQDSIDQLNDLMKQAEVQQSKIKDPNATVGMLTDAVSELQTIAESAELHTDILRSLAKKALSKEEINKAFGGLKEAIKEGNLDDVKSASGKLTDALMRGTPMTKLMGGALKGLEWLGVTLMDASLEAKDDYLAMMRYGGDRRVLHGAGGFLKTGVHLSNMEWAERMGMAPRDMAEWRNTNRARNYLIGGGNEGNALNTFVGMMRSGFMGDPGAEYKGMPIASLIGGTAAERKATLDAFAGYMTQIGKDFTAENVGREFESGGLSRAAYIQGITPQELAEVMSGIASMPELQAQFLTSSDQQIEVFMRNNIELMNVGTALGMSTQAVQALTQQMINNQKRPMMERIRNRALMGVMGNVAGFNAQEIAVMQQLAGAKTLEERQRITTDNASVLAGLRTKVENLQMDDSMSRLMLEQVDGLRALFEYIKSETILTQSKNAPGVKYVNEINDSLKLTAEVTDGINQDLAKFANFIDLSQEAFKTASGKLSLAENVLSNALDAIATYAAEMYDDVNLYAQNVYVSLLGNPEDMQRNQNRAQAVYQQRMGMMQQFANMSDADLKAYVDKNSRPEWGTSNRFMYTLGVPIELDGNAAPSAWRTKIVEHFKKEIGEVRERFKIDPKTGRATDPDAVVGWFDEHALKDAERENKFELERLNIAQLKQQEQMVNGIKKLVDIFNQPTVTIPPRRYGNPNIEGSMLPSYNNR